MDDRKVSAVQGLDQVLPSQIVSVTSGIFLALQKLYMRHMTESGRADACLVSDSVPDMMNTRLAKVVRMFTAGEKWCDVARVIKYESGYAIREI